MVLHDTNWIKNTLQETRKNIQINNKRIWNLIVKKRHHTLKTQDLINLMSFIIIAEKEWYTNSIQITIIQNPWITKPNLQNVLNTQTILNTVQYLINNLEQKNGKNKNKNKNKNTNKIKNKEQDSIKSISLTYYQTSMKREGVIHI